MAPAKDEQDLNEVFKYWEEKAKEAYKESLHFIREGFHGLEVMAEKTMEVTKVKLANQKALSQIKTLFSELGQRVFNNLDQQKNKTQIKVTPELESFVEQIKSLQERVEKNLADLAHATTMDSSSSKKKKASASKKKKKAPTKKSPSKKATKKKTSGKKK